MNNSSTYKGLQQYISFFPQMRPERRIATDISLSDEEKAVFEILKKVEKITLVDLKSQSGLSNKKWDKTIKNLTKNNLVKVEKTAAGLFVEII